MSLQINAHTVVSKRTTSQNGREIKSVSEKASSHHNFLNTLQQSNSGQLKSQAFSSGPMHVKNFVTQGKGYLKCLGRSLAVTVKNRWSISIYMYGLIKPLNTL